MEEKKMLKPGLVGVFNGFQWISMDLLKGVVDKYIMVLP